MSSNWKSKPPFSCVRAADQVSVSATCQRLIVVSRGLKLLRPMVSTVRAALLDDRLRGSRCWPRPAPGPCAYWHAHLVEQRRAEHAGPRRVERAGLHERVAGVLERVLRAAVLEVLAGEVLVVVAQRERGWRRQLVVGLDQEDVLVLRARPSSSASGCSVAMPACGRGVGRRGRRQVEEHDVRLACCAGRRS